MKRSIILKLISIITISLIHLPSQKFSIPYGMGVFMTLTERISELEFSSDFFLNLLFVVGLVLIFRRNKWTLLVAYFLMIIPLIFYIMNVSKFEFGALFWIPLSLFIITSILVVKRAFKNQDSNDNDFILIKSKKQ